MKKVDKETGLNQEQEAFCQYYVLGYGKNRTSNGVAAYRMAYKKKDKKSWHYNEASRLLDLPQINLRIQRLREEENERIRELVVTKEDIVSKLWDIINSDPLDQFDLSQKSEEYIRNKLNEMPKRWRQALQVVYHNGKKDYKFIDKEFAFRLIAEILGLKKDQVININNGGPTNVDFGFGAEAD